MPGIEILSYNLTLPPKPKPEIVVAFYARNGKFFYFIYHYQKSYPTPPQTSPSPGIHAERIVEITALEKDL